MKKFPLLFIISPVEKWNIISSDEEIFSTVNDFVANTVTNLSIAFVECSLSNLEDTNPVLTTVNWYDKYPSIKRMKYSMPFWCSVSEETILAKLVKSFNLNIKKACQNSDIHTRFYKNQ